MITDVDIFNAKILIVDDIEENILLFEQLLETAGYHNMLGITDPLDTFDLFESFCPDLILLDINMPKINGYKVMEQLKKMSGNDYVPILVLTAQGDMETRLRSLKSGAKDFISKPFDNTEALTRIRNMLEVRLSHSRILQHNMILEQKVHQRTKELKKARDEMEVKVKLRTQELQKANAKLQEEIAVRKLAEEEAKKANEVKSEFLANISHELRTPMNPIIGFAMRGMERFRSDDRNRLKKYFSQIYNSAIRLLGLLNDLLDLSKLEAGKMRYQFMELNINIPVKAAINEFSESLKEKNITLEFHQPDFDDRLILDHDKIIQVLNNLISNAIKFSIEGSVISIDICQKHDTIELSVKDMGLGIPEDELEEVFDKFIQSSKTRSKSGGTGLGLAISKQIISDHKGHIWAENNPDGGTIFKFALPMIHPNLSDQILVTKIDKNAAQNVKVSK